MDTVSESVNANKSRELFKRLVLESLGEGRESLSPEEDECFVCAQRRDREARQIGCRNRVCEQEVAADCDCHRESCCC